MRGLSISRKHVFTAILLLGNVLALVSYFSPWLRLYLSGGESPGEREYTLSILISPGGHVNGSVLIGIFVPIAVMALCSVAFIVLPASPARTILGVAAGLLAVLGLVLTILFLTGAPTALALGSPYYDTRGLAFGAWFALAGFLCVAVGAFGRVSDEHSVATP